MMMIPDVTGCLRLETDIEFRSKKKKKVGEKNNRHEHIPGNLYGTKNYDDEEDRP